MTESSPHTIVVISDGTGETAKNVIHAALRQFDQQGLVTRVFPNCESHEQIHQALHHAFSQSAFAVSTLVHADARTYAEQQAQDLGVPYADLFGDLIDALQAFLCAEPAEVAGLKHQTDANYFRRIEAVEFTVKADDGKEPRMLNNADIVLIGVSRTSKTPLSTYLAHKGFKVGNVPIVLDQPLPNQLFQVDANRIFALTIDPSALQHIRRSRLRAMGMQRLNYDDLDYILAELEYAEHLFRGHPTWPVIDVTNKAVEETAANILGVLQERALTNKEQVE